MGKRLRGLAAIGVTAAALAAWASPAAAVTVGQLAPGSPTASCGTPSVDELQPTVTSGTTYVVPPGGTMITSWSTNAGSFANRQLIFKVFRKTADPAHYMVVANDPRTLTPSALNSFPVNIAVQPGDVIGLDTGNAFMPGGQIACNFPVAGETTLYYTPGLADGGAADFNPSSSASRLNVSAQVTVSATATGERAAALKKCKHKHPHKKRKKCKKRATKLPV